MRPFGGPNHVKCFDMGNKYLNTFWLAPLISFIFFISFIVSAIEQLFPVHIYFIRAWIIAVIMQAIVMLYQFLTKKFKTGSISLLLLSVPIGCLWLLSRQ
jgi:hypothetical protein